MEVDTHGKSIQNVVVWPLNPILYTVHSCSSGKYHNYIEELDYTSPIIIVDGSIVDWLNEL